MPTEIRRMGWLPDVPSFKDYSEETPEVAALLAQTAMPKIVALRSQPHMADAASGAAPGPAPKSMIDLSPYCSPIEDQRDLGSCTANAAVALVEYFEKRTSGKFLDASRLFVYKTTRNLMGLKGDTGASIRSTMESLVLFGTPPEAFWPYDIPNFDVEPTSFCYAFAANYEALKYFRLDPNGSTGQQVLDRVKNYLLLGFPSMFGFPVYDEFMHVPKDGKVAFPAPQSKLYGGHAQVAVGFDDNLMIGSEKGALLVRNSWGENWGLSGYAWMSYKYITASLAQDWWTIIDAKWVKLDVFN